MSQYVLAIDAGTTAITILLFDGAGRIVRRASSEFAQHYPKPGWVEHDAEEIWRVAERLMREVVAGDARSVAGIGITNQRETTVLWDAETRAPYHNAIVWQCRRTAPLCEALRSHGRATLFRDKTGLVLDAYFSGTKVAWLLENVPAARAGAESGRARFGTIDTWLVDRLSGGRLHVTDPTNASRTLLYNIHERAWDDELLAILGVPRSLLPEVRSSSEVYGTTDASIFGAEVPICGIAGDQQAALFGQGCVEPGSLKNTYGTGCFALLNAGRERVESHHGLIVTLGCDRAGEPVYCIEGSVFVGGAVVQWLRDQLGIIADAAETNAMACSVEDSGGVFFVPAFAGLGAPYWDMEARGAILGLTRGTSRAHIVRAALESIAFQTRDLVDSLTADLGSFGSGDWSSAIGARIDEGAAEQVSEMRIDGGAAANDFLAQFQADLLGIDIVRPKNIETTAQGAAILAGLACGFFSSYEETEVCHEVDRVFHPRWDAAARDALHERWKEAVRRVLTR